MLFYFALANWGKLEDAALEGTDYVLGFMRGVLFPFSMGAFLWGLTFRFGTRFVKKPYLCPDAVQVWTNVKKDQ